MGEHNAQVLAEAGFSPAEIAALAEARVIVQRPDCHTAGSPTCYVGAWETRITAYAALS